MKISSQHRLLLSSACRALAAILISTLLTTGSLPASAADLVWVGNDSLNTGNFKNTGNWENNTQPSWGYTNSLKFNKNENPNVTTLNYDWGNWREVNDIFWDTTFNVSRTLSASAGGGINFKTRIENNSSFTQTVAMELSGGQDGASDIQLNPVNGSLIFSGTLWNDFEKDYVVWGSLSSTTTTLTINTALGTNADPQSAVDFTVSAGRNSNVQVNASQVWAGNTTVNSGSFITANGVTLASTAIVVGGGTVATTSANTLADAATLTVNSGRLSIGGNDTVASLAGSGGTVDIASGATLTAGNVGSTSYAGSITGSGGFTKVGSGTFTLSAASSYTGTTTVGAGRLSLAAANLLADSSAVTGSAGAVLALGGNETIGSLAGSLDVALGSSTLTAGGNGQTTTYSGNLSGSGGFSKAGGGNLILSGSSTYFGATSVSAGRLSVNGSLGTTAVTVQNGGELGGSGSIAGALSVLAGGTLSPGNSIESLIGGETTFSGSSTFEYEYDSTNPASLAAAADLLVVNGNLTINPGAILTLTDLASSPNPFVNYTTIFALINYSGTWNSGLFTYNGTELTDGARFFVGSQEWQIDYNRTSATGLDNFTGDYLPSSSFVAITAVPEPSTWAMALAGLACGGLMIRRRRAPRRACCETASSSPAGCPAFPLPRHCQKVSICR
jgi:autotransporter-associated beta strand protein